MKNEPKVSLREILKRLANVNPVSELTDWHIGYAEDAVRKWAVGRAPERKRCTCAGFHCDCRASGNYIIEQTIKNLEGG